MNNENKKVIIAMIGKAGSGKDTAGAYISDEFGFKKDSFAGPIKRLVQDIFGLTYEEVHDRELREQPLEHWPSWTVRKLLQFIGTELFRNEFGKSIWVKSQILRIQNSDIDKWIITDARFPNELSDMKKAFGDQFLSIKVVREGCDGQTKSGIKEHESESYDLRGDYTVENNGTIDDLFRKIEVLMREPR